MNIYGIHIDDVAKIPDAYMLQLAPERCRKADRYLRREDRLRCLGAGYLVHHVLRIDEKSLKYGEYGKPYVPGGPEFCISHGGNWVLAVSDALPVGVDIEPVNPDNIRLAKRVFTPEELEWMDADPVSRFHTLWTLKESLMKAVGLGFHIDPRTFSVLPVGEPHILHGGTWYTGCLQHDGCAVACASAAPVSGIELIRITYPQD